jgi:hypothetical protein
MFDVHVFDFFENNNDEYMSDKKRLYFFTKKF